MLQKNIDEQKEWAKEKQLYPKPAKPSSVLVKIDIKLEDDQEDSAPLIRRSTNESYALNIALDEVSKVAQVEIAAHNYFGARHALESLFQLIEFDAVASSFILASDVAILDWPEFRHRGISVDTSRNFIEVNVIRRIIDGMAHSKVGIY